MSIKTNRIMELPPVEWVACGTPLDWTRREAWTAGTSMAVSSGANFGVLRDVFDAGSNGLLAGIG
jgi:hypothetical protein